MLFLDNVTHFDCFASFCDRQRWFRHHIVKCGVSDVDDLGLVASWHHLEHLANVNSPVLAALPGDSIARGTLVA